ncbi:uncharacterized protein BO96DRAFT_461231 [Aspergillus niger CBS 101883]|uniref:uncharacterized protein n=1 Tax=Aspergillus lacticoffeatus (strain CBS 101883) TaxID=1450533 RepID=UPI000D7EE3D0|nr:uncharacterized protein BO96DRAFT_461231 [Aspergillus niger CBS 101883]PYH61726.1 hypothetical protein BO96DRAFT_461231 [Aspergillus niger CBS 101883]
MGTLSPLSPWLSWRGEEGGCCVWKREAVISFPIVDRPARGPPRGLFSLSLFCLQPPVSVNRHDRGSQEWAKMIHLRMLERGCGNLIQKFQPSGPIRRLVRLNPNHGTNVQFRAIHPRERAAVMGNFEHSRTWALAGEYSVELLLRDPPSLSNQLSNWVTRIDFLRGRPERNREGLEGKRELTGEDGGGRETNLTRLL